MAKKTSAKRKRKIDPDDAPEQTAADFARAVRIADGPEALRKFLEEDTRKRRGAEHDFTVVARRVVEQAIGEKLDGSPLPDKDAGKNPAAVALGKLGGAKGGKARAKALSADERSAIARKAAQERWAARRQR